MPDRLYAPGTTPTYSARHVAFELSPTSARTARKESFKGYLLGSDTPFPYEYTAHVPAGALASTATDIARFMIAHLNQGALQENRILQATTARLMHTTPYAMLPPLHGMGFGFYQHDINGRRVIFHDGDTRFFHSQLNLFVDENVGIFVSVNSTGRDGAADILRAALFRTFADRYFPYMEADGQVDSKIAAQHARAMVGHYVVSDRSSSNFLAINRFSPSYSPGAWDGVGGRGVSY
ncbi:serine hydrolase [Sphingosinicella soli]|uniref:CubicO group peptidase (Beta-lactamase class C family) n=1 Tax=Sphingosinicella soli TaxID=333708 RepID=A0A7W7B245_9SPHN|nr:CubicO group peptidase (beta-lactamase class C family) [Sphingosinicella soli]